jgi:putative transposase
MNYKRLFIQNGLVFITIVTEKRIPILTKDINLLKEIFNNVSKFYIFELIAYVVLQDHIHCIIKPKNINEYPKIIKSFKYSFTKNFNVGLVNPTYKKLWQNRYWEHTIRDENDFYRHLDYIHYNPIKHGFTQKAIDYPYSSFEKFVGLGYYSEDWCNFEDKNNISKLNYE